MVDPGLAPGGIKLARQRPSRLAQVRRGEILELLDQDVGAARWRGAQHRLVGAFEEEPGATERRGAKPPHDTSACAARVHWNDMSRHLEMSEPRPEEMVMQPRTFCWVVSAAQIE